MAALIRHGVRRIGGSLLHRTQAAVTSPAVADERRRLLVPRRMIYTDKQHPSVKTTSLETGARSADKLTLFQRVHWRRHEDLLEQFKGLKPHQICWELIRSFPVIKIVRLVLGTTILVFFFVFVAGRIFMIAVWITVAVIFASVSIELKKRDEAKKKQQLLRRESSE